MDYLLLGLVFGYPPLIVHDAVDVVFSPPCVDSTVKELGVGISFFDVSDSGTLLFACFLKHGQAYHSSLKASTKVMLLRGEKPALLGNVEAKDNQ